jgi:hypothetical protein
VGEIEGQRGDEGMSRRYGGKKSEVEVKRRRCLLLRLDVLREPVKTCEGKRKVSDVHCPR